MMSPAMKPPIPSDPCVCLGCATDDAGRSEKETACPCWETIHTFSQLRREFDEVSWDRHVCVDRDRRRCSDGGTAATAARRDAVDDEDVHDAAQGASGRDAGRCEGLLRLHSDDGISLRESEELAARSDLRLL